MGAVAGSMSQDCANLAGMAHSSWWAADGTRQDMKGDRVEIVIDAGGMARTYDVVATRAGRRVEVSYGRSVVEVTELTRSGTPVRTAR